VQRSATAFLFPAFLAALGIAHGADPQTVEPANPPGAAHEARDPWLDRAQQGIHHSVSRSAAYIDRMFGAKMSDEEYDKASGSVSPALLWSEFDGFQPKVRFRVDVPLPHINERLNAFVGRVDRDEYVTERAPQSGAIQRLYGPMEDEQTILGISYRDHPEPGGRWDFGAGVRVRFPLDPYVKAGWVYQRGSMDTLLFSLRETGFWQNSENLGLTSRIDLERLLHERWLMRWTGSATVSQETHGMRGYSSLSMLRAFPPRRAIAAELFIHGETEALVPLAEYGAKVAWRQSVVRDWLVLEVRTSVTWPKDFPEQQREPSWGVGLGFEMLFGEQEFLARPVTF
jgi:hypothetical protein